MEVLKDITFRLAPATKDQALSMLDGIQAAEVLNGVRGAEAVDKDAIAEIIVNVSNLIADFPVIQEMDLNPVFATADSATAVDALITVDYDADQTTYRPSQEEILAAMQRVPSQIGGRDRCLGRRWQDRQFGDEEPDQWRL